MPEETKKKKFDLSVAVFLLLAVLICVESHKLGLGTLNAPESGFFPFLLGTALGLLSILWLVLYLAPRGALDLIKVSISWKRAIPMLAGLLAYALLLELLGFLLATFLLIFLSVWIVESRPWWVAGSVGIGITAFTYVLFRLWLHVQLPAGWLDF